MLVKFFANKKGGSTAALDYLLNERREQSTASILAGDEKLTRELINSISNKQKVCAGVLSFSESADQISEQTKKEIMESFEKALLTEQMKGRYNILWVEHSDKNGRLELNFVIPKIDLESQKSFNPYYHKADLKRIDCWKDIQNIKHGLSDPKDPSRERALQAPTKKREMIKDYLELEKIIESQIGKNINSKSDLLEFLKGAGIEVTRNGKDYISVKLDSQAKAKRFKGEIYSDEFKQISYIATANRERAESEREYNSRNRSKELYELERELDKELQRKARFYDEIHQRQHRQRTSKIQKNSDAVELYERNSASDDFERVCVDNVDKALSSQPITHDREQSRGEIFTNRAERTSQIQRQASSSEGILNDSTRNSTLARSGEIIQRARKQSERVRELSSTIRETSNQLSDFATRIQRFSKQCASVRERIKELESTITKAFERVKEWISPYTAKYREQQRKSSGWERR